MSLTRLTESDGDGSTSSINTNKINMVRTLLVLLWKHFTVRIRRFIQTPIEYLSPLLLFLLLFAFKDDLNPVQKSRRGVQDDVIIGRPVSNDLLI